MVISLEIGITFFPPNSNTTLDSIISIYKRNRGQTSNFSITPENFNLMNDVYSQPNNFFNYRTINPNKLNLDNFHNSITWTKTKTAGELVDTWTPWGTSNNSVL